MARRLKIVLQTSAISLEPIVALVIFWHLGPNMLPERWRIVVLKNVRQFVNDNVVNHMHRRFD